MHTVLLLTVEWASGVLKEEIVIFLFSLLLITHTLNHVLKIFTTCVLDCHITVVPHCFSSLLSTCLEPLMVISPLDCLLISYSLLLSWISFKCWICE